MVVREVSVNKVNKISKIPILVGYLSRNLIMKLLFFNLIIEIIFGFGKRCVFFMNLACVAVIPMMTVQEHAGNEKSCV